MGMTFSPRTDPSAMATLQMLAACMLPAANTDRFLPAGVVLQFWPGPLGELALGQMP